MQKSKNNLIAGLIALVAAGGIWLAYPHFSEGAGEQDQKKTEEQGLVNGLDAQKLNELADQLKKDPQAGRATFFSETKWSGGMKSVSTFSKYEIDGQVKKHARTLILNGDEMAELSGTDTVPGAVEEMMYAVGTCIVAAANANAAVSGVKLTKLEVSLESDIDMHGLMGLDPKVRPGLLDFRTKITIAGDADEETLKKIALSGYNLSPVSDTVRNGVTHVEPPQIVVEK